MTQLENIYAHEATVIALSSDGAEIQLALADAHVEGKKVSVMINFRNVRQLLIDGIPSSKIGMVHPDGEVLTLSCAGNVTELIVEWNDFKNHFCITRSYKIVCDGVESQVR